MAVIKRQDIMDDDVFTKPKSEAEALLKILSELKNTIKDTLQETKKGIRLIDPKSVDGAEKLAGATKKVKEETENLTKVEREQKRLQEEIKRLASDEVYRKQVIEVTRLKEQKRQYNQELKQEAIATDSTTGAYKKLSNELNIMRAKYKDLAVQGKAQTQEATKLLQEITKVDTQLKEVDKTVGQNQRFVGGYEDAIRNVLGMLGPFGQQLNSALSPDFFRRASEGVKKIGFQFGDTKQKVSDVKNEVNTVQNSLKQTRQSGFLVGVQQQGNKAKDSLKQVNNEVDELKREAKNPIGFKINVQRAKEIKAQGSKLPNVQNLDNGGGLAGNLNENLAQTPTILGGVTTAVRGLGTSLMGFLATPIGAVVGALGGLFALLFANKQTIIDFDNSIKDLEAITGASGEQLEFLKNQAIELGKSTTGGAKAVVEAYKLIASAKPELLENAEALDRVTQSAITLSQASGLDLQESASRLTDAMNQFGLGAEEADRAINVLAAGSKLGGAEVPQLTEALLKFGATAKGLKIPLEESVALVEAMSIAGLKGAEAGTAIRNVLLKVSAPDLLSEEAKRRLNSYEISFEKLKDTTIPFNEKLKEMKPLLGDVTSLGAVFGVENVNSAQSLIQLSETIGTLKEQVTGTTIAQEQSAIANQKLSKRFEELKQTFNSFILGIEDGSNVFSDFAKLLVNGLIIVLKGVISLGNGFKVFFNLFKENKVLFVSFITGLGLMNIAFIQSTRVLALDTLARIRNFGAMVQQRIQSLLLTAQMSFQNIQTIATATGTNVLTVSMRALWLVMRANPLGVIATALTLVAGAMLVYANNTKKLTIEQQALNELKKEESNIRSNEINSATTLISILNNQSLSYKQRNDALKELQKINPEYFKGLSLEAGGIEKNNELLKIYIKQIEKQSKLKALISLQEKTSADIEAEKAKSQEEYLGTYDKLQQKIIQGAASVGLKEQYEADLYLLDKANTRQDAIISDLEKKKSAYSTELTKLMQENPDLTVSQASNIEVASKEEAKAQKKADDERKRELKKAQDDRLKEIQEANKRVQKETEDLAKKRGITELETIIDNYERERANLKKQYADKSYLREQYNALLLLLEQRTTLELSKLAEKQALAKEEADKKIIELENQKQEQLKKIREEVLKFESDQAIKENELAIQREIDLQKRFIDAGVLDLTDLDNYYKERLRLKLEALDLEQLLEVENAKRTFTNSDVLGRKLDEINSRYEVLRGNISKEVGKEAKTTSTDLTTQFKTGTENKVVESQKDLYNNLNQIADAFYEREQERLRRKEELIDKEIALSKDRQQQLTELAKKGIEDANDNLAFEQRKQAELELKKQKQQQKAKLVELGLNALKTYTTKLENKDKNPLGSTIKDISFLTAFIRTLPAFYEGTENTGKGGDVDNKGGFLSVLHPNERVMTAEQNKALNGLSNNDIVTIANLWKANLVKPIEKPLSNGLSSINNLDIKQAIIDGFKTIEIPTKDVEFNKLTGIVSEIVSQGQNKKITNSKVRKKW